MMPQNPRGWVLALLILSLCDIDILYAADDKEQKVKWEGFVRSEIEADSLKNGEVSHEGRLNLQSTRQKGLRAELEIDLRTRSDDVKVREALLDKRWEGGLRLQGGFGQKRLGLEYEEERLDRPTIDRSFIYRQLEVFAYVGRETIIKLSQAKSEESRNDWSLTAAYSEAQNSSLIASMQKPLDEKIVYSTWLSVGTDRIQSGVQLAAAMAHALWMRDEEGLWQLEWTAGMDPDETEFELLFDNAERILFNGLHGLYGKRLKLDDKESWLILGGLTAFSYNHKKPQYNSLGIMLGIRYDLDSFRLALNGEVIGTNSPIDLKKRAYDESNIRFEALYAF